MMLSREALERAVLDLMEAEIALLRRERPSDPLQTSTVIRGSEVALDSLELLQVALAVARMYHLHETGLEDLLLRPKTAGGWVDAVERSLSEYSERITFRSSGSSGEPKVYTHESELLEQEVAHWATQLPPCRRVVAVAPLHHIYGFIWGALLPSHLGIPMVSLHRRATTSVFAQLREGDLVISHPVAWKMMAQCEMRFPPRVTGVVSSGPVSPAVVERLTQAAGLTQMWEIYGASETGGVGARTQPDGPFQVANYWTRRDPETGGELFRQRPDGTTVPYELPDILEWRSGREFVVLGRIDQAVQVAGVNVYPQRIAEVICQHPAVQDCLVRLMQPHEGDRLKAFVALVPGADNTVALRRSIEQRLHVALTRLEMPRSWTYGHALPVSEMGKAIDWRIDGPIG